MRFSALFCLSAFIMTACASAPTKKTAHLESLADMEGATPDMIAADQATQTYAMQQAQLREIRNAEARVDLARARLDWASVRHRGTEDGDVRDYLDARQSLRQLRSTFGPTDTGYRGELYHALSPFGLIWLHHDRRERRRRSDPSGISGGTTVVSTPRIGAAEPLSGLPR